MKHPEPSRAASSAPSGQPPRLSLRARLWLVAMGPALGGLAVIGCLLGTEGAGHVRGTLLLGAVLVGLGLATVLIAWLERAIKQPVQKMIELSGRVSRE